MARPVHAHAARALACLPACVSWLPRSGQAWAWSRGRVQQNRRMHAAVTRHRRFKLGDFGLAIDTMLERSKSRVGTLDYMSPEVSHGSCLLSCALMHLRSCALAHLCFLAPCLASLCYRL